VPPDAARDENAGAKEEERESGREEFAEPTVRESQEQCKAELTKRANMVMLRCLSKRVLE
jgi:hypothetical protein